MNKKDLKSFSNEIVPGVEDNSFSTYLSTAEKLFEENKDFYNEDAKNAILSFAKYLDGFNTLSVQMQLLALQQSRKIDREVLFAMAKVLGPDRTTEIIKEVHSGHKHTDSK